MNDTPVSNTIFIIEKTPPLGVTGRIGLFKKGKRDEIEVVGCWKGQCVNNFVADCRFMCDKPRGGGNGGFCGDHMVFRGERRGDQSSPIEYRMRTRQNWVQISRDHRNITEPYKRFHYILLRLNQNTPTHPLPRSLSFFKTLGEGGGEGTTLDRHANLGTYSCLKFVQVRRFVQGCPNFRGLFTKKSHVTLHMISISSAMYTIYIPF